MSRSMQIVVAIGISALLAYVLIAALHDLGTILLGPLAPYVAFMSP